MPLTAVEAGNSARAQQSALDNSRYNPLANRDPIILEASESNRVYIFNVGPWSHQRSTGSSGTYFIPACPEGDTHSAPLIVNGLESESYPINETECAVLPKTGRARQLRGEGSGELFAQQLLGEGPMLPRRDSLRPFGVFISSSPIPLEAELNAARKELRKRMSDLVGEANVIWLKDRANAHLLIQVEWHHKSALTLGKTPVECPWLGDQMLAAERQNCPSCGTPYEVGIAECAKCGDVLDEAKYAEKVARLERAGKKKK